MRITKTFIDRVHDEISWLKNSDNQKLLQKKFNELKTNSNKNQNFYVSIFLLLPDDKKLTFRTLLFESGIYLNNNNAKNKRENKERDTRARPSHERVLPFRLRLKINAPELGVIHTRLHGRVGGLVNAGRAGRLVHRHT